MLLRYDTSREDADTNTDAEMKGSCWTHTHS